MTRSDIIKRTPWDSKVFGLDTYEILESSEDIVAQAIRIPGHYTVKVDPLCSKKLLHEYGFYYCDTLIEPYCNKDRFISSHNKEVSVSRNIPIDELIAICSNVFEHGRFHRDFNIDKRKANVRYVNWLRELYHGGNVYGFLYRSEVVGFLGYSGNKMILHAITKSIQGKGLAKYFWSAVCTELFNHGHRELLSSISASNLPAVNLYASLGFRFRNALDVYHRLIE